MRESETLVGDARVLELWERAVGLDRWRRDEALLCMEADPPSTLGRRNTALLDLRNACFGRAWPLKSLCPACGAACEFEVDVVALVEELERRGTIATSRFEWKSHAIEARAPTVEDLVAAAGQVDAASAARIILARCLSSDLDLASANEVDITELGRRIESLDPGAAVGFDLVCPACAREWAAMIDIGEALWAEVRNTAERTLIEIDVLARTYGWTEEEVMRLSPTRRAAYLQLIGAA
jgi:hypothetical protein